MTNYLPDIVEANDAQVKSNSKIGLWIGVYRELDDEALREKEEELLESILEMRRKKRTLFSGYSLYGCTAILGVLGALYALWNAPYFHNRTYIIIIILGVALFYFFSKFENNYKALQESTDEAYMGAKLVSLERGKRDFV
jgi:hypothetical protein